MPKGGSSIFSTSRNQFKLNKPLRTFLTAHTSSENAFVAASRSFSSSRPHKIDTGGPLYRTDNLDELWAKMEDKVVDTRRRLADLKTNHSNYVVDQVKLSSVIGGMRDVKAMLWNGSTLDPENGISFHGEPLQSLLPKLEDPSPSSILYLLLTSTIPTRSQSLALSRAIVKRSVLSSKTLNFIDSLPPTLHPMTQLRMSVDFLETSIFRFQKSYASGKLKREDWWKTTLEDSLDLWGALPSVSSRIYWNLTKANEKGRKEGAEWFQLNEYGSDDFIGNYAKSLQISEKKTFEDYLKLYIALHSDHEGGNVSAHTAHLVASPLATPNASLSASLSALSGPLHGLANQEVLRWILRLQKQLGDNPTDKEVSDWVWSILDNGGVIVGYGHAVLRAEDPRFTALQSFINENSAEFKDSTTVKLVNQLHSLVPGILVEHGKSKNPNPNVDAVSGCLLYHYGLTEFEYYTVVFGISRALGTLSQIVWDRALGLPIERPKSLSIGNLEEMVKSG